MLAVIFHTRHRGYETQYEASCVETMDSLLLTLAYRDAAPPSMHWLSGYVIRGQFLRSFEMYAKAARRDGYLTDAVRLRMVQACLMFDRRAEAREWHDEMTETGALEWSRTALTSPNIERMIQEFEQAWIAFGTRWGALRAAVFSSLLFSLVHGYSFEGTILIACYGLLMCAFYHRTGTLLVPMMIHALTNALLLL